MPDSAPQTLKPLALVTGASSGIGLELARELARRGHRLVIAAEEERGLEAAAAQLRDEGASVETRLVDLADPEGVITLAAAFADRPIDVLCINAGVGVGGPFTDTDLAAELAMIDLNIRGAVQLTKPLVQAMQDRGQGRILFTSSIVAATPAPMEAVYGATKAFLRSFAEGLRNELIGSGVTVTALMPGATDTNVFRRAGMVDTVAGSGPKADPAKVAKAGIDALMAGDHRSVPGAANKAVVFLGDHLPDPVGAWLHRGFAQPGGGAVGRMMKPALIGAAIAGAGALLLASRRISDFDRATPRFGNRDQTRKRRF